MRLKEILIHNYTTPYLPGYTDPLHLLLACSFSVSSTLLTHGYQEKKMWKEQRVSTGCCLPLGEEDI